MTEHQLIFNHDLGAVVLSELERAYINKEMFFSEDTLPHRLLPFGTSEKSLEHAMFLFVMTILDVRNKSNKLYERAQICFSSEYDLLEPETLANIDKKNLVRRLKDYLQYPMADKMAPYLIASAQKLVEEYGGDPRNIFSESENLDDLYERIEEFSGYGQATSRLLVTYYHAEDIFRLEGNQVPQPKVDFHDIRFLYHNGLLRIEPFEGKILSSKLRQPCSDFITQVCKDNGLNSSKVDYAMWTLGANLCIQADFLVCKEQCPMSRFFQHPMPSTDNNYSGHIFLVDTRYGAQIESKRDNPRFFPPWKNVLFSSQHWEP